MLLLPCMTLPSHHDSCLPPPPADSAALRRSRFSPTRPLPRPPSACSAAFSKVRPAPPRPAPPPPALPPRRPLPRTSPPTRRSIRAVLSASHSNPALFSPRAALSAPTATGMQKLPKHPALRTRLTRPPALVRPLARPVLCHAHPLPPLAGGRDQHDRQGQAQGRRRSSCAGRRRKGPPRARPPPPVTNALPRFAPPPPPPAVPHARAHRRGSLYPSAFSRQRSSLS